MKAAWQYKQEWEETNFLRLIVFAKRSVHLLNFLLKKMNVVASIILFLAYSAVKFVFALIYLLVATEPYLRNTKEEMWIFRQIK